MTRNKAEDFTATVKRQLRDRVANYCSNPSCGILTVAAKQSDSSGISNIGEAAHICAVQPNGARYNSAMTSSERKSIENGIWLCSACHHIIDTDPMSYPIGTLKEWKTQAELKAINSLKKCPKNDNDIIEAQQNLVSVMPLNSISNAINNVHKSVQQSLEDRDSRLNVYTKFDNGINEFTITPKNPNDVIKLNLPPKDRHHLKDLILHGIPVTIEKNITFETDSPLVNYLLSKNDFEISRLMISPSNSLKAILKCHSENEQGFDDYNENFNAVVNFGVETLSVKASIFNFLEIELKKIPLKENFVTEKVFFSISFNYDNWENSDIRTLKDVENIYQFIKFLTNSYKSTISLLIDNNVLLVFDNDEKKHFEGVNRFLSYLIMAIKICKTFNFGVLLHSDYTLSEENFNQVKECYDRIKGNHIYDSKSFLSNPEMVLTVHDSKEFKEKISTLDYAELKIIENGEKICIFGNEFELPPIEYDFQNFSINTANKDFKDGDSININLLPSENSKMIIKYLINRIS